MIRDVPRHEFIGIEADWALWSVAKVPSLFSCASWIGSHTMAVSAPWQTSRGASTPLPLERKRVQDPHLRSLDSGFVGEANPKCVWGQHVGRCVAKDRRYGSELARRSCLSLSGRCWHGEPSRPLATQSRHDLKKMSQ